MNIFSGFFGLHRELSVLPHEELQKNCFLLKTHKFMNILGVRGCTCPWHIILPHILNIFFMDGEF